MPSCALEAALWLVLAIELEQPERPPQDRLVEHLLEASTCHGWGGSPLLLVPTRFDGDTASHPGPHADEHGLMTTAAASWALARWSAREA